MQKNLAIFWHCFLLFKRPVQRGYVLQIAIFPSLQKTIMSFYCCTGLCGFAFIGWYPLNWLRRSLEEVIKQLQGCFLFSSGKPINCPDVTIFKLWDISTSDFEISSNASRCGFINENSLRAPAYWAEPPNSSYLPLRYCPFCKGHPYEIAETI